MFTYQKHENKPPRFCEGHHHFIESMKIYPESPLRQHVTQKNMINLKTEKGISWIEIPRNGSANRQKHAMGKGRSKSLASYLGCHK